MDYENLPKLTVIVGAGASHDVANEGTQRNHLWQPPLAADLFRIDKRRVFEQLLNPYPGAGALVDRIAPLATKHEQEFDLERTLRRFADHSETLIRQQFRQIPAYIRAVIVECSKNYVARPACFDQLIGEVIAETPHRVLFLVLNYDTFVERALESFDPAHRFRKITEYVESNRQAMVVKVHGSVDWFVEFKCASRNWLEAIQSFDIRRSQLEITVHTDLAKATHLPGIEQDCADTSPRPWKYPVLTAPLAGKEAMDLVCPSEHLAAAKEFLKDCKKFLVIGTSGRDDDLFQLLESGVPRGRGQVIQFVGRSDVREVADRYRGKVQAFGSARHTLNSDGFRQYMTDPTFQEFLKEQVP